MLSPSRRPPVRHGINGNHLQHDNFMSDKPYIVSARKYRPATFKSVVGQKNLTNTLKNAIDTGRLAQAYLFCGPRGVGKTSCARIFAKTINCLSPTPDGEACGVCDSCRAIDEGNSFNIIELDAASNNSVDDIRSLTEQVSVPPTLGRYRIFIIDEVHMLSSSAFNAFLKTLEEPPSYVIFILATTEKHKVIPTILSRCQIYDFKRITIQDMVDHLQYVASQEDISTDIPSLNVIAKKADGAMRDALSIFDQVAASSFGHITYESTIASLNVLDYEYYFKLVEAFRAADVPQALMLYKEIRERGFDSQFFINGLASHIRDLMVAFSPQTSSLLEVADDVADQYRSQAQTLPIDWHYAAMKLLNDCDCAYRTSSNKQFLVELTLIKLCQLLNPPTPPFDRVDSDHIQLRDIATPPPPPAGASVATTPSQPSASPASLPQAGASAMPPADRVSTPASANPAQALPASPIPQAISSAPIDSASATTTPASQAPSPATDTDRSSRRKTVRGHRNQSSLAANAESDAGAGQFERQRQPVSLDAFKTAWDDYIIRNPDKQILVSAMRKSTPELKEAETFRVVVDHPALRQAFDSAMGDLITHLRQTLHNDFIIINVEIDDSKQADTHIPPHELLKEIVATNPALADFLSSIDGELA